LIYLLPVRDIKFSKSIAAGPRLSPEGVRELRLRLGPRQIRFWILERTQVLIHGSLWRMWFPSTAFKGEDD